MKSALDLDGTYRNLRRINPFAVLDSDQYVFIVRANLSPYYDHFH